jgi:hypothetical protein
VGFVGVDHEQTTEQREQDQQDDHTGDDHHDLLVARAPDQQGDGRQRQGREQQGVRQASRSLQLDILVHECLLMEWRA